MINLPVYIISLNNKKDLEYNYDKNFSNVNMFEAVNAKNFNLDKLLKDKVISWRVYNDIKLGRKDHFAFSGKGAIGLYLTWRKLMKHLDSLNLNTNVLIFEEDNNILDFNRFNKKVQLFNDHKDFDCVFFGTKEYNDNTHKNIKSVNDQIISSNNISNSKENEILKDFKICNASFYLAHSFLLSPRGIKKLNLYLNDIIEFQVDAYIWNLAIQNKLKVYLEKKRTTEQFVHVSTLNNDYVCKICDMNANDKKNLISMWDLIDKYVSIGVILFIIIIIFYYLIIIQKR